MQKASQVVRNWHLVDASDKVLGMVATDIARKLTGKDKKEYTPHIESGDYVVVVNAAQVVVTGSKAANKMYYRHSNYPGGLRSKTFTEMIEQKPENVIILAVKNMLPKNRLRDVRLARLKVYAGQEHKHASQLGKTADESTSNS